MASRRVTVARDAPSQPQRRRRWSGSTTQQDQHRVIGFESLPDCYEAQLVEQIERGPVRGKRT